MTLRLSLPGSSTGPSGHKQINSGTQWQRTGPAFSLIWAEGGF